MSGRQIIGLVLASLPLIAVASTAHAQSDIRVSAEAAADIGYSANPFSLAGDDLGSAFVELRATPAVKLVSARDTFVLTAPIEYQRYFTRYGDNWNYGAALDYRGTPNERLGTHLNLYYDSSVIGQNNLTPGVFDPTLPELPINSGTDISLFGTRDRRTTLGANGDVSFRVSARDSLSASAYYLRSRYRQFAALGDNDGYGGSVGYLRHVSERLQLGVQGSVAQYDYRGILGDSTVYSAQASFAATLGPGWKASGALGASFVDGAVGGSSTLLSGNLRLCHDSVRSDFCLLARRAVLPTGISGTQNTTTIGANYSYKLTERGTIFSSADYSRNGTNQFTAVNSNEFVTGSLGYRHTLRERVSLNASGRYRKIFGGIIERTADYGGQIGLTVQLGDRR